MTVRLGDRYRFERTDEFMNHLDVDHQEIASAAPEDDQEMILKMATELSDRSPDSIADLTEEDINEYVREVGLTQVVIQTLDARDAEYVHLRDNSLHTVVELHPEREGRSRPLYDGEEYTVDGRIVDEGISVSVYDSDNAVVNETWVTDAEIEDLRDRDGSAFTFSIPRTSDA
ncbi:hypothetical protein RYH80_18105 [Halobaculum sp. MBLA0147]|uniref:hypothetical protein n=1 Tax=Halobaculum sp. MBLA0147 TaxID=3079934 RepID=UPI00352428B1